MRRARVTSVCMMCNEVFDVGRNSSGMFCSRACSARRQTPEPAAACPSCGTLFHARQHRLRDGKDKYCSRVCYLTRGAGVELRECLNCHQQFPTTAAERNRGRAKYCSHACYSARPIPLAENPNKVYNTLWQRRRVEARERDGNACVDCGRSDCRLHVHHQIPYRVSRSHALDNLVTLCPLCHKRRDDEYLAAERAALIRA